MKNTALIITVSAIGSLVWLVMQFTAWLVILKFGGYEQLRKLLIGAIVVVPAFVMIVQTATGFMRDDFKFSQVITMTAVTAWAFILAFTGFTLANALRRILARADHIE